MTPNYCLMLKVTSEYFSFCHLLMLQSINVKKFHFTHNVQNRLFSTFCLLCDLADVSKVESKHLLLSFVVHEKHDAWKSWCKLFFYLFSSNCDDNKWHHFVYMCISELNVFSRTWENSFKNFDNYLYGQ